MLTKILIAIVILSCSKLHAGVILPGQKVIARFPDSVRDPELRNSYVFVVARSHPSNGKVRVVVAGLNTLAPMEQVYSIPTDNIVQLQPSFSDMKKGDSFAKDGVAYEAIGFSEDGSIWVELSEKFAKRVSYLDIVREVKDPRVGWYALSLDQNPPVALLVKAVYSDGSVEFFRNDSRRPTAPESSLLFETRVQDFKAKFVTITGEKYPGETVGIFGDNVLVETPFEDLLVPGEGLKEVPRSGCRWAIYRLTKSIGKKLGF